MQNQVVTYGNVRSGQDNNQGQALSDLESWCSNARDAQRDAEQSCCASPWCRKSYFLRQMVDARIN